MQDVIIYGKPVPDNKQSEEQKGNVEVQPYRSCCSQVTCLPCISQKAEQKYTDKNSEKVPASPLTINLNEESHDEESHDEQMRDRR